MRAATAAMRTSPVVTPAGLDTTSDEDDAPLPLALAERRDGGTGAADGDPPPKRLVDTDATVRRSKAPAARRYPMYELLAHEQTRRKTSWLCI
jgi:hypothetical protein